MEIEQLRALLEAGHLEVAELPEGELYRKFEILNGQMQVVYDFVLAYMDYINERHNYTSEEELTMLEAHLLTDICDKPNMTVTSLARSWHRSISATSQTIRKLISKELVFRVNSKEDAKVFFLRPTSKGMRVSDAHKRYDTLDTIKTLKTLRHDLTYEELDALFKGLKVYCKLLYKGKE